MSQANAEFTRCDLEEGHDHAHYAQAQALVEQSARVRSPLRLRLQCDLVLQHLMIPRKWYLCRSHRQQALREGHDGTGHPQRLHAHLKVQARLCAILQSNLLQVMTPSMRPSNQLSDDVTMPPVEQPARACIQLPRHDHKELTVGHRPAPATRSGRLLTYDVR